MATENIKGPATIHKYNSGMFGGKFIPFHKGHLFCIDYAASICAKLYVILFFGGADEDYIFSQEQHSIAPELLSVESRISHIKRATLWYPNVEFITIDISTLKNPDGSDNWDLETDLVIKACGYFDIVFSGSEEHYKPYFDRAYPWADFMVIDPGRTRYPISATMIRMMEEDEELKWLV